MRKSYCAQLVHDNGSSQFLAALFLPPEKREELFAVYALDIELAQVHQLVSEETLGHIRYAWWEESVQAIASGHKPREHPVLQALTPELAIACLPLVESYRAHFPHFPPESKALDNISIVAEAHASPAWKKAKAIIDDHRQRYGRRKSASLYLKLLRLGIG